MTNYDGEKIRELLLLLARQERVIARRTEALAELITMVERDEKIRARHLAAARAAIAYTGEEP